MTPRNRTRMSLPSIGRTSMHKRSSSADLVSLDFISAAPSTPAAQTTPKYAVTSADSLRPSSVDRWKMATAGVKAQTHQRTSSGEYKLSPKLQSSLDHMSSSLAELSLRSKARLLSTYAVVKFKEAFCFVTVFSGKRRP